MIFHWTCGPARDSERYFNRLSFYYYTWTHTHTRARTHTNNASSRAVVWMLIFFLFIFERLFHSIRILHDYSRTYLPLISPRWAHSVRITKYYYSKVKKFNRMHLISNSYGIPTRRFPLIYWVRANEMPPNSGRPLNFYIDTEKC